MFLLFNDLVELFFLLFLVLLRWSGYLVYRSSGGSMARDYKKEYRDFHGKPEQIALRSKRNKARRKLGLEKGDPREADHKRPLSKGGGNGRGNLRAVSRGTNRRKGAKRS